MSAGDQLRSWRMRFDYSYRLSEELRGLAADNAEFPVLVMARGRRKRAGARMGSRARGVPCAIQSHSLQPWGLGFLPGAGIKPSCSNVISCYAKVVKR